MSKIPTALELAIPEHSHAEIQYNIHPDTIVYKEKDVIKLMKKFAKLHVKAALKKAHNNMQLPKEDLEFTLNAYPEDLIK